MKSEVQVPQSDLLDNLSDLLEAHEGADVYFKVEGQVFPAHKIILAIRSPVFKAEFYGPMRNKCGQSVTIEDISLLFSKHCFISSTQIHCPRWMTSMMMSMKQCLSIYLPLQIDMPWKG